MRIELIIVVALALGATFFVVVVAVGLLINKIMESRRSARKRGLQEFYGGLFADLLLQPVPEEIPDPQRRARYEQLLGEVKSGLKWSGPARKALHRDAIRSVLLDFSRDVSGESRDRLRYFFESLGFVRDEQALLKSRKWWIRAQAARDLGLLGALSAADDLMALLDDEHPDVRAQVMGSLVKLLGEGSLEPILSTARSITRWTALELSLIIKEFEERAYPYLLEALSYADQSVVLFSIEMLSQTGFVATVEPLMRVAETYPNIVVRARAIEALGRLGDQRAESLLHNLLNNPYPSLRAAATRALERIGSPSSVPQLKERFEAGSMEDRLSAARALARSGDKGMDILRQADGGTDATARAIALHVLEETEGIPA